jgi:hypothetical protein
MAFFIVTTVKTKNLIKALMMELTYCCKHLLTCGGLHGVIAHKTIITVTTSNPTEEEYFSKNMWACKWQKLIVLMLTNNILLKIKEHETKVAIKIRKSFELC